MKWVNFAIPFSECLAWKCSINASTYCNFHPHSHCNCHFKASKILGAMDEKSLLTWTGGRNWHPYYTEKRVVRLLGKSPQEASVSLPAQLLIRMIPFSLYSYLVKAISGLFNGKVLEIWAGFVCNTNLGPTLREQFWNLGATSSCLVESSVLHLRENCLLSVFIDGSSKSFLNLHSAMSWQQ